MDDNAHLQEQNLGTECIGSSASYVKLISADGFCFYIKKSLAFTSPTIRDMHSAKKESNLPFENVLYLNDIQGRTMNTVCKYLQYKAYYEDSMDKNDITNQVPLFPFSPEESLDCLLAASYINI